MIGEEICTEEHIHIYSSVLLNRQASHGKGQPEVALSNTLKCK